MLRRLFAREAFEPIEEELANVYQTFGLEYKNLKIRKQPATYSKAYSYMVEGVINTFSFVLGLHHSPLKEQHTQKQLEFIIHCDNPNWLAVVLRKEGDRRKKILEPIQSIQKHGLKKLILESNNKEWAEGLFDKKWCERLNFLEQIKFSTFSLERKRLYIQLPWLPDDFNKRTILIQLMEIAIGMVIAVDET